MRGARERERENGAYGSIPIVQLCSARNRRKLLGVSDLCYFESRTVFIAAII